MTGGLDELYREVLIEHSKQPRNRGELPTPPATSAEGFNPLCGDRVRVFVETGAGGRIERVRFDGEGCAISTASASIMTELLAGKTPEQAERLAGVFAARLRGEEPDESGVEPADLDRLAALSGVSAFPMRVKCATLAWHAARAALAGGDRSVTTE